jgi:hypothetical protein
MTKNGILEVLDDRNARGILRIPRGKGDLASRSASGYQSGDRNRSTNQRGSCFATCQGRKGRLHARQRGCISTGDPSKSRQTCARRPSPSTATLPNGADGCLFPPLPSWWRPRRIRSHFLWPAGRKIRCSPLMRSGCWRPAQHATSLPPANGF